jgi:hypothetical protein
MTSGCAARYPGTDSARSAVEQLLLTTSVDRALAGLELADLEGRRLAVEIVSLGSGEEFYVDAPYLGSRLELRLASEGARIVDRPEAEVVARAYVEALGTHVTERLLGIETYLPLFDSRRQEGITRVQIVLFDAEGRLLRAAAPGTGKAFFAAERVLFLLPWIRQDILPGERGYRAD